jgi:RNA polymerase sigma-70 factor, ECF subfamily
MTGERDNVAAEDAALVARVAEGDREDALGALYDRYGPRLYGFGLRLLGDPGMAEELVQDTFVRLWQASGRFDPAQASVRTFLFTLARRAGIDQRRRSAARPPGPLTGDEVESDDQDLDYDDLVLGLDVRDALDALTHDHREVLELYYRADMTQREIADRLGLPLGTVKTRTYHGLRALKLALDRRLLA